MIRFQNLSVLHLSQTVGMMYSEVDESFKDIFMLLWNLLQESDNKGTIDVAFTHKEYEEIQRAFAQVVFGSESESKILAAGTLYEDAWQESLALGTPNTFEAGA